jgi:hypothetical protein
MLVSVRGLQGWQPLEPEAAILMGRIWERQLDRHGVAWQLYDGLVECASDRRTDAIADGQQPPGFSVELMIACYRDYRSSVLEEYHRMKTQLANACSVRAMYESGHLSEGHALAALSKFVDIPKVVIKFPGFAEKVISEMQRKVDDFLQEKYIAI